MCREGGGGGEGRVLLGEGVGYLCNARPKRSDPQKQASRTATAGTSDIKVVGGASQCKAACVLCNLLSQHFAGGNSVTETVSTEPAVENYPNQKTRPTSLTP